MSEFSLIWDPLLKHFYFLSGVWGYLLEVFFMILIFDDFLTGFIRTRDLKPMAFGTLYVFKM